MTNQKLLELYKNNWDITSEKLNSLIINSEYKTKPTNPLLLVVSDEEKFNTADIRIIIYGQETNNWGGDFENNIDEIKCIYNDFFNTKYCFKYGGQFWNGIKLLVKKIHEKYPNKSVEFLWNNVVKIGRSGKKNMPPKYIYKIEKEHFNVLNKEIEIIKPNLLIFLSGPNYDYIINNQIKGFNNKQRMEGFTKRELLKFMVDEKIPAYRTYHPNYLWRNNIHKYFDAILNDLKIE